MSEKDPWWRSALCAQIGGEEFFLEPGDLGARAKSICARCEVRAQCLADEIQYPQQGEGIFGGFGYHARKALHRAVERGGDPLEVAISAIEREELNHRLEAS